MSRKVTYELMIEKLPQPYLVEQLSDKELCSFHSICKNKPVSEQTDFEKSRINEYLPLLEDEITKRKITIKKAKEQAELSRKKKEEGKETEEYQDLEDEGTVSDGDEDNMEKAEGSRGGKVIGHTKSGKPIYEKHEQEHTQHYTHEDHSDAMTAHMLEAKKHSEKFKEHSDRAKQSHEEGATAIHANKAADSKTKQNHHSSMAALHEGAMNQKMDKEYEKKTSGSKPSNDKKFEDMTKEEHTEQADNTNLSYAERDKHRLESYKK